MENICLLTRACETTAPNHEFVVCGKKMTLIPINLNVLRAIGLESNGFTVVSNTNALRQCDELKVQNNGGLFIIDDELMFTAPRLSKAGEDNLLMNTNVTVSNEKMMLYQSYHRVIYDSMSRNVEQARTFTEMCNGYRRLKQILYTGLKSFLRDDFKEVEESQICETGGRFDYMFTLFYMASVKRMDLRGVFTNDQQLFESMVIFAQNMIIAMLNEYFSDLKSVNVDVLASGLSSFANITPYALSSLFKSYLTGVNVKSIVQYFVAGGTDLSSSSKISDLDVMFWLRNKTEVQYSPAGDYASYSINDKKYIAVLTNFNLAEEYTSKYSTYVLVNVQPINKEFVILQLREKELSNKVDIAIKSYDERGNTIINYTNDHDMVELIKRSTRKALITIVRASCLNHDQFESLEGDLFRIYVRNLLMLYSEDTILTFSTGPLKVLTLLEYAPVFCENLGRMPTDVPSDQIDSMAAAFDKFNDVRRFVQGVIDGIRERMDTNVPNDVMINDICTLMSSEIMRLL